MGKNLLETIGLGVPAWLPDASQEVALQEEIEVSPVVKVSVEFATPGCRLPGALLMKLGKRHEQPAFFSLRKIVWQKAFKLVFVE